MFSKGQPTTHGNGATLLRRIEVLDEEMNVLANTGHSRWMIPYADLVTVLLGLFMLLFAMNPAGNSLAEKNDLPGRELVAQAEGEILPVYPGIKPETPETQTPAPEETQSEEILQMLAAELPLEEQKNLTIYENNEGVVISLKDSILFAPGSAELGKSAQATLDQLLVHLNEKLVEDGHAIRVEGHTDNTPIATAQYPSNWELSTARATAIVRYFSDRHGIPPAKLSAVGYGEFHPVAENSSIGGKQKNRRVDIVILSGDIPPHVSELASPHEAPMRGVLKETESFSPGASRESSQESSAQNSAGQSRL